MMLLGIDPGRSKTGLALVDETGAIKSLHIALMECFEEELVAFCNGAKLDAVVLGDGTNSKVVSNIVANVYPCLAQYVINEAYSTEEARKLYWEVNPPQGWKKLVPLGLLVPDEPMDAYAAVVQVRRWLQSGDK